MGLAGSELDGHCASNAHESTEFIVGIRMKGRENQMNSKPMGG